MRFTITLFFALLLLGVASCGDSGEKFNAENSGKFTLSDATIAEFEASPESRPAGEGDSGRLSAVPAIFASDILENGGVATRSASVAVPGVVVPGPGDGGNGEPPSKCSKCKIKCGKCTKKVKSCKCKGGCQPKAKCGKCKSKCGKCSKQKSCSCSGKCKPSKCGKCKSKCSKCSHDGKCGCKGKCKKPCGKCKGNCKKCSKDKNCGCGKCACPPPCYAKCTGIKSTGDSNFTMDCETGCADVAYKVRLSFTDCPGVDSEALGHEVVFTRNGIEVGRATTDINGVAWLADDCLEPGTYNIKAQYGKCVVCFDICVHEVDCCEVECTGITCSSDTQFEADCATHCAEVTYEVKLTFNDCPDVTDEALGHEVIFYRDGAEIGRGVTDADGNAELTEDCLAVGDYTIEAEFEDCHIEFPVKVWEDCCEVVCTGMDIQTERFILADCWETSADIPLQVELRFSECPGKPFDKSGHEVTFADANGNVIGTDLTDANGEASFNWQNRALGNHHVVVTSDQACATEFIVTVYEECRYHACVSGKGKLPGMNGSPYMVFQYEGHVQDGHLEMANTMSMSDGNISFTNLPIDWIIVLGLEIYFGSADGNVMFHAVDNGKAPGVDYLEVWVFDQNYYNSGNLVTGQIRSSWGLKKPPVAIP